MNLFKFITKYKSENFVREVFEKDLKELLKTCKSQESIPLCFHTLLENQMPFEYLKQVIEYDEKGKKDILHHPDTFKWACAFGQPYLLIYLNDKVKNHNILGSINATIINYRLGNLKTLEVLGYEKDIYSEENFCQAISRADQVGCGLDIVEYLLKNKHKFKQFSSYVYNELKQKQWMDKICQYQHTTTLQYLLDIKLDNIAQQLFNYTDDIMSMALYSKTQILQVVMKSYLKDKFVDSYLTIKNKNLKDNISLDENDNLQTIIANYPELIQHEDIKLYMMNNHSLTIDKFIKEKRKITLNEIKRAYIDLSDNPVCFQRLCEITPKFKVVNMKIAEVIKIVNNMYVANEYNDEGIDYNYDGQYMKFNRKNLLHHKDFKKYIPQIEQIIDDKHMFDILKKEQMKKELEARLPEKTKVKKLKI